MTIIYHTTKKPKGRGLHFEYFSTGTGRKAPEGFQLRVSVEEDPLVRIYEQVFVKDERR